MSIYNDRLQALAQRAQQQLPDAEDFDDVKVNAVWCTLLAATFDYEVKEGGFDQLILAVGGDNLEKYDQMLSRVNAPKTLAVWRQAMYRCAQDIDEFRQFLTRSDMRPGQPSTIAVDLLSITVQYLKDGAVFDVEIEPFLDHAEAYL